MKDKLMRVYIYASLMFTAILTTSFTGRALAPGGEKAFLGRWDIEVKGAGYGDPNSWPGWSGFCWFELTMDNGILKGRIQEGGGATTNVIDLKFENNQLSFRPSSRKTAVWTATVKGKRLEGTVNTPIYGKDTRTWTGVRAPTWPAKLPNRKPLKPIDLLGIPVSDWLLQYNDRPIGWIIKDGILMNEGKGANNIYTKQKFQDFNLKVEFNLDPKSNSGLYLRGRYEVSVNDGFGRPLTVHSQGALYGYIVPPVDAAMPAGEWQTFDITIIANRVTVILNGTKLIDNGEIPGLTGGALDASEGEPGPLMIQGDHGTVKIRNLILTPLI